MSIVRNTIPLIVLATAAMAAMDERMKAMHADDGLRASRACEVSPVLP